MAGASSACLPACLLLGRWAKELVQPVAVFNLKTQC